jgi:hypothetical protein
MKSVIIRLKATAVAITLALAASVEAGQSAATVSTSAAPKAITPSTSFDFGDIYRGETISYVFIIRNEGSADLVVKDFSAGCGCSVAESDRVIPPGKEGRAILEVDTSSQAGAITKIATLRTNDPARSNIIFSLVANVLTSPDGGPVKGVTLRAGKHIGPLFVAPHDRWIARVASGQKARTEFMVSVEKGPVRLMRVESATPRFVSRIETVEEGKLYRLVVETTESAERGSHTGRLWVITDSAALPSFRINIFIENH